MDRIEELEELAECNNIVIDYTCPASLVAMSVCFSNGKKIISISRPNKEFCEYPERSSSTELERLSHEMGHCITDSFYSPYASKIERGKHEYRANKWAINYLIPFDELQLAVNQGNYELWQLAEYFEVSPSFVEKAITYHESHGKEVELRAKF